MPPSPSSWPLSVLDLSPLRHHPRLPIPHARSCACCTLCWPGVVPLVPTVSLPSLCLVLVCIRWPPPCVLVELSSSQRFLSTGNGARQHIKMGHTLRAASLDLHLENPSPSLPSNPMLFPSLFPAVIPFPGGIGPVLDGAPHHIQNFCNKAHMSRRCWLIFSCISRPEYVAA